MDPISSLAAAQGKGQFSGPLTWNMFTQGAPPDAPPGTKWIAGANGNFYAEPSSNYAPGADSYAKFIQGNTIANGGQVSTYADSASNDLLGQGFGGIGGPNGTLVSPGGSLGHPDVNHEMMPGQLAPFDLNRAIANPMGPQSFGGFGGGSPQGAQAGGGTVVGNQFFDQGTAPGQRYLQPGQQGGYSNEGSGSFGGGQGSPFGGISGLLSLLGGLGGGQGSGYGGGLLGLLQGLFGGGGLGSALGGSQGGFGGPGGGPFGFLGGENQGQGGFSPFYTQGGNYNQNGGTIARTNLPPQPNLPQVPPNLPALDQPQVPGVGTASGAGSGQGGFGHVGGLGGMREFMQ